MTELDDSTSLDMTILNLYPSDEENDENDENDDDENPDDTDEHTVEENEEPVTEPVTNLAISPASDLTPEFEIHYDSDTGNEVTATSDTDATDSDALDPSGHDSERRQSKWSATILFVASEIQLIINLAEFCPPEGFERKPQQQGEPDCNSNMEKGDNMVEMQPVPQDPVPRPSGEHPNKDFVDNNKDLEKGALLPQKNENKASDKKHSLHEVKAPVENWRGNADYLLAAIGYSVDLANVWRFPYLAYKNGGGAFIIPYFTVLILGAIPVFFMELAMGQYSREGPINVWNNLVPMFRGIGMASCLMAYIVAFYYNMVIAWAFYYLFSSFAAVPPWSRCDHSFNTANCWQSDWDINSTSPYNRTYNNVTSISSAFEFFERGVLSLHKSSGVDDLGPVKWQTALCAMLTFTVIYFCLWKSVKSAGKVVWFTATIPYIILTVLLVRGCLLPGSAFGIKYFITPNISRLGDVQVWIDAAIQIFFSIGAGFGTHIAYASYNKFNNNCYRDCLITASVNSFTSIYSGFVIFAYLGYMAEKEHKDIKDVAQDGPGLVFIVYPEAISTLPGSTIWAVLFFFMLVTLGMDSAFGGLESPLTGLRDQFYRVFRHRWSREILTLVIVVSAFLFSMPCMTVGGMYAFKILDAFAAGISLIFVVLMQVVGVAWVYGVDQFCADIHEMTGHRPGYYWRICWKILSPTFLLIIVISSFLHYKPLIYHGSMGTYTFPVYANVLGWCIALVSMMLIPGYVIYRIIWKTSGSFKQRLAYSISPRKEHEEIQNTNTVKRFRLRHWITL